MAIEDIRRQIYKDDEKVSMDLKKVYSWFHTLEEAYRPEVCFEPDKEMLREAYDKRTKLIEEVMKSMKTVFDSVGVDTF